MNNNKNNDSNNKTTTLKTLLMLSVVTMMMLIPGGIISVYAVSDNLLLTINNPTPEPYDFFGNPIASTPNGNILVGAYLDNTGADWAGSAYMFDGNDGSLLLTINNPTPEPYDRFGYSIADTINGNILVGAPYNDIGATSAAGSAYLFDGNDGSLLLTINNPAPELNDSFGYSIASTPNGNILVGAYMDNTGADSAGAAYLFDGTLRGTTNTPLLTINNPTPEIRDFFGSSIASTPNGNILVGAFRDNTGADWAGSAYMFDGNDGSLLLTINNPTPEFNEWFGGDIGSTPNGNILVGAGHDDTIDFGVGSAYLFDGTLRGTTNTPLLTINNPTPEIGDLFGISVAGTIDGNIIVGAQGDPPGDYFGSAYLFDGNDGSLLLTINNPTPEIGDLFGKSVAGTIDGNILVGAVEDNTDAYSTGSVYLFEGVSTPSQPVPIITSLVANDPDDLDNVYSNNDTITITFDSDTNTSGGMGIQTKTAINDLYTFTESLGEAYTGQWNTTDTFVITITNATGATPPIIDNTTVTPAGITPILSYDGTSDPSTITSSALSGDFGIIELFCGQPESFYNVINGTELSDYLVGTNSPDLIFGNDGSDMIYTRGDNNCIYAGNGNDSVLASNDGNMIYGGAGDDFIMLKGTGIAYGEDGDDAIYIMRPSVGHLLDGGNDYDLCIANGKQPINTTNCEIIKP